MNHFYFKSAILLTSFFVAQHAVAEDSVAPLPATVETPTTDATTTNAATTEAATTDAVTTKTVSGDALTTDTAPTVHNPLIVTATRTPQTIAQALAPATVITREEIENSQAQSLPELLQGLPGIDLTTQGGPGKATSLFLRGTGTGHTLYMIDGVRIGSATLGTAAIEDIPLQQIDRIEIVRGPRSSLYGSEAIGGVIQVFTRKGDDKTRVTAKVGHGTYNTHEADAGVSGNSSVGNYSLHAAATQTDGINALDYNNPDNDGYKNQSLTAAFNRSLGDISDISINFLHSEADNDYDASFSSPTDIDTSKSSQNIVNGEIKLYGIDALDNVIRVSRQRDESSYFKNNTDNGQYDTARKQITWQGDYHLNENNILTLGYEKLAEEIDATTVYTVTSRDNRAVFGQMQTSFAQQDVVLALRTDNNEAFGHHRTGNIDWRWNFADNASITASYGQAFKAPTFNELYYPFGGNPDLSPQESRSSEIMTRISDNNTQFSLSFYKTQTENMIEWITDAPGSYNWIPVNMNTIIEGMETVISTRMEEWTLRGNINLIDPRNNVLSKILQRRARQSARIDLDRDFSNASAGISLLAVGKRFNDAYNTEQLAGYGLLNLHAAYTLDKSLAMHVKVDNALDKEYITTIDYNNLGRSVFVSLSYSME